MSLELNEDSHPRHLSWTELRNRYQKDADSGRFKKRIGYLVAYCSHPDLDGVVGKTRRDIAEAIDLVAAKSGIQKGWSIVQIGLNGPLGGTDPILQEYALLGEESLAN